MGKKSGNRVRKHLSNIKFLTYHKEFSGGVDATYEYAYEYGEDLHALARVADYSPKAKNQLRENNDYSYEEYNFQQYNYETDTETSSQSPTTIPAPQFTLGTEIRLWNKDKSITCYLLTRCDQTGKPENPPVAENDKADNAKDNPVDKSEDNKEDYSRPVFWWIGHKIPEMFHLQRFWPLVEFNDRKVLEKWEMGNLQMFVHFTKL